MGLDTLIGFFVASVILALAPGPDNIFVMTHSMMRGREAGLAVVMGLCTGLLVHTTAVALGIAILFQTSDWAFTALKTVGAAYLLYLSWQALTTSSVMDSNEADHQPSLFWSYRRGIIMNITNPKVTLFFLAFLPQFIVEESGQVTGQIIFLGALFIVATIVVFGTMALLAGRVSDFLRRSPLFEKNIHRLAGGIFIGLAGHLLLIEVG
ncbi:LysE family translocator [uncultured Methylophaga sp.]|uniref:LysE family translocator n=1 Tax=uncultured Methylophaga sp. TaxID=285271 RepID=UPI002631330E|nr:LysE family translocator [uncultured Methylophaga sp.]